MEVTYIVDKEKVLKEVRRLTTYVGQRKGEDGAFERISATDSDREMLEQFWQAACSSATEELMHYAIDIYIGSVCRESEYEVEMDMPSMYDDNLNESVESSLQNFFVNLITSKWCKITNPDDEAKYAAEALGFIRDIDNKIYQRKRPTRENAYNERACQGSTIVPAYGNSYYKKPKGGIPKTDLAEDVRKSLNKADTAIQKVKTINNQSIVGEGNITIEGGGNVSSVNGKTGVVVLDAEDVGAYELPENGIPASDMASEVQTALEAVGNKEYVQENFSGRARVNLEKNIQEIGGVEKNILTQDMLYKGEVGSRVPNTNTIFVIQYDFDLNDEEVTIPEGCVLKFDGGSITNGTVVFDDTKLEGDVKITSNVQGHISNDDVYVDWFGAIGDGVTDDSEAIRRAISVLKYDGVNLHFSGKTYMHGDGLEGDNGTGNSYQQETPSAGASKPKAQSWSEHDTPYRSTIGRDISMVFVNYNKLSIYGHGATILSHPNNGECKHNKMFLFICCTNLVLKDITLNGNKDSRGIKINDYNQGNDGFDLESHTLISYQQTGYSQRSVLQIQGGRNILLENVNVYESMKDGITISGTSTSGGMIVPENVEIKNCVCEFNARQGLTISVANNVRVIGGCYRYSGFDRNFNTLGMSPMSSIDLEADSYKAERLVFECVEIGKSNTSGVVLTKDSDYVSFTECIFKDMAFNPQSGGGKRIIVENCKFYNTQVAFMRGMAVRNNYIEIDKNYTSSLINETGVVVCSNTQPEAAIFDSNIINIICTGTNSVGNLETFNFKMLLSGNVEFTRNYIKNMCSKGGVGLVSIGISKFSDNIFDYTEGVALSDGNTTVSPTGMNIGPGTQTNAVLKNNKAIGATTIGGQSINARSFYSIYDGAISKKYNISSTMAGKLYTFGTPSQCVEYCVKVSFIGYDGRNVYYIYARRSNANTTSSYLRYSKQDIAPSFDVTSLPIEIVTKSGVNYIKIADSLTGFDNVWIDISYSDTIPCKNGTAEPANKWHDYELTEVTDEVVSPTNNTINVSGLYCIGESRPTGLSAKDTGLCFYDSQLNKPLWYTGTAWVDATGTVVS